MSVVNKMGTMAKSALLRPDKSGKRLHNLYTGTTVNSKLLTGVVGGIGAAAVGATLSEGTGARLDGNDAKSLNRTSNLTLNKRLAPTAPAPSSQGVAPSILAGGRQTSNADNLGATGDMVFGMHNNR